MRAHTGLGLVACLASLVALLLLAENRTARSELLASGVKDAGNSPVEEAADLGELVHKQAAAAEKQLEQKIAQLKAQTSISSGKASAHVKKKAHPKSTTTPALATPSTYSQETRDLYDQAREYEDQAREMYYKSEETYWQANSQASYEDWKRGQQEWDYWYNRPGESRTSPAPMPGVTYGYYNKADDSFVQLYAQRLREDGVKSGLENVARTEYLMAELMFRANVPGATHKSWLQTKARWDADKRYGRVSAGADGGEGGASAMLRAALVGGGAESKYREEGALREQARELYLEALQGFVRSAAAAEGVTWRQATARWDQGVLRAAEEEQGEGGSRGKKAAAKAAKKEEGAGKGAAKEAAPEVGFVERARGEMAKEGVYSAGEAVARVRYLAARDAFIRGGGDRAGRSWGDAREEWGQFLVQEEQLDAAQRAVDAERERVLRRFADERATAAQEEEEEQQQAGEGERGGEKKGREEALYEVSDETPSASMLRHYWRGFTARPPSRLPAFGMASTAAQMGRHVEDAARAAVRDCGGAKGCSRAQATLRAALRGEEARKAQPAAEEKRGGKRAKGGRSRGEEEAALEERVQRMAQVLKEAEALRSNMKVLRAIRTLKRAKQQAQPPQAAAKATPPAAASAPPRAAHARGRSAGAGGRAEHAEGSGGAGEAKQQRLRGVVSGAGRGSGGGARARETRAAWARVEGYVQPWVPERSVCGGGEEGGGAAVVREQEALCRVLAIVHAATGGAAAAAPEFRTVSSEGAQGHSALAGVASLSSALAEVNREQAHLNHLRLKLYVREFGAPYVGERAGAEEVGDSGGAAASSLKGSAGGPKGIVDGVMALLGLAPPKEESWDQKLAGLLAHLHKRREDWHAVTRAWDNVGAGADGEVLLPAGHAEPGVTGQLARTLAPGRPGKGSPSTKVLGEKEIWAGLQGEEQRLVSAEEKIVQAKRAMQGVGNLMPRFG